MKIAIIQVSKEGRRVADLLDRAMPVESISRQDVGKRWDDFDAFVFIGAMGICVRTIAPYVKDKHEDPAVVCVDSLGQHVISVLSGHVGGANELTRQIAAIIEGHEVITTQSDIAGLWALDTFEQRFGWRVVGHASQRDSIVGEASKLCSIVGEVSKLCSAVGEASKLCSNVSTNVTLGSVTYYMQSAIFAFVNRQPTALLIEASDEGTDYLLNTLPPHVTLVNSLAEVHGGRYKLCIIVSPTLQSLEASPTAPQSLEASPTTLPQSLETSPTTLPQSLEASPTTLQRLEALPTTLHFVPRVLTVGVGLAHQAEPANEIIADIHRSIEAAGYHPFAIDRYCTIDVKRDEPVVRALQAAGETVCFYTADELAKIEVPNPSNTVQKHVGTPSVSEAAAILGSNNGKLIIPKQKGKNWTVAVAKGGAGGGSIEIVGAGPGDPDLISVRGRRMLERADLILYAGSLVPKALTNCHKPGAMVRSSADMNLEEQCALMKEHYDKGHFIVRLHTGDPCIFGAIQEQMAFFDANNMHYHITPGISSFLAAAAELQSQFTIPERCQSIILTRGEGRTPMPEKEQLHLLARSQSTMCIFLSASIVDDVQRELLMEYPEDTPVAACYHLTWPDQKIYRGQLKDLARIVHDNHLTLTTMLVVGEAIDNRSGLSELYSKHFTHLFRQGEA